MVTLIQYFQVKGIKVKGIKVKGVGDKCVLFLISEVNANDYYLSPTHSFLFGYSNACDSSAGAGFGK
jgi:hypothetical protein